MAVNNIYIGDIASPSFSFTNDQLIDISVNTSVDPVGNELKIDTLQFKVYHDDASGNLRSLTYSTPIWVYSDTNFVGKFYFKNIERVGQKYYVIDAVSVIGLLEYEKNYGGFFVNKNVKEAVEEAITGDNLTAGDIQPCEYLQSNGSTPNTALLPGNVGANATVSGKCTSVRIKFQLDEVPETSASIPLWFLYSDGYNGESESDTQFSSYGVRVQRSGSNIWLYLSSNYFSWSPSWSDPYDDVSTGASIGELFEITFQPSAKKIFISRNGGAATVANISWTIPNRIVPIYFLVGGEYRPATGFVPYTTNPGLKYKLYGLEYLSDDLLTTYAKFEPYADSLGNAYVYDPVGENVVAAAGFVPSEGSAQSDTFYEKIVRSIIWQTGVDTLTFSGWIPSGTRRETLHQILFALNLNLYKTENGDIIIGRLPSDSSRTISDDEIYDSGSTEDVKKPKQIELTENAYTAPGGSAEYIVVFDNSATTAPEGKYIAEFSSAPIYGTPIGHGITIVSYNANAAIVSGRGTIEAKTYSHSTQVIVETVSSRPDGDTVAVTNATLVTFLNSASVMEKLKAYYANNAYKIKNAVIANGELVGMKYTLHTPFMDLDDAYLISANAVGSNITKVNCEFIAGYVPISSGGSYTNVTVLTGSGTWVCPDGVETIHVVLIGGGRGGDGGFAGEDAGNCWYWRSANIAKGGAHGENGTGGKIYELDIEVNSPSFSYSCGQGGTGGSTSSSHDENNPGSNGTATTFTQGSTTYSSESGQSRENGYTDALTGRIYAGQMPESVDGGDGGYTTFSSNGQRPTQSQCTFFPPGNATNPFTGNTYFGGNTSWYDIDTDYGTGNVRVMGSGGGAALTANGEDGNQWRNMYGGNGANATWLPPTPTSINADYYGYGGIGGAGGGAGGSTGFNAVFEEAEEEWLAQYCYPGTGGYGGRGGNGAAGCILVYT